MSGALFLDLCDQQARRTIVDRVPGHYLGQPDTVLLEDGATVVVAYPNGHGGPDTLLKRSTDGGRTWSERLPVPDTFRGLHNAPTIHRLVAPDGTRRLWLNVSFPRMWHALSEDDGRTWTDLRPMLRTKWKRGFKGHAPMKSVIPVGGSRGRYLGMYHDHFEGHGGQEVVAPFVSLTEDGGDTWSDPRQVGTHTRFPGAKPCEPCLLRAPGDGTGRIVALLRETARRHGAMMMHSDDDGETWSDMVELPATLTGDRHVARFAPDGRILVTLRDMAYGSDTYGDFVGWVGTWEDLLAARPGQYRLRLLRNHGRPGDTGYAGLEVLPDGTFLSTTYCVLSPGDSPLVVSLHLHLDELDGVHGGPGSGGGSTPSGRDRANPARPNPARSLQNPGPR